LLNEGNHTAPETPSRINLTSFPYKNKTGQVILETNHTRVTENKMDQAMCGKVARSQVLAVFSNTSKLVGDRFKEIRGDDSSHNRWNLSKCFSAIIT